MPAQEARHRRAHREGHEAQARVGHHHHEGEQLALRPAHRDLAEVRPVDLRLLPGQHRATQVRLRLRARAQPADDGAEAALGAGVPARPHHPPQPTRAQARILRQRLLDEGEEGIDQAAARHLLVDRKPAVDEHALDGVVVAPELVGDRPHRPALDMVQAEDRRDSSALTGMGDGLTGAPPYAGARGCRGARRRRRRTPKLSLGNTKGDSTRRHRAHRRTRHTSGLSLGTWARLS